MSFIGNKNEQSNIVSDYTVVRGGYFVIGDLPTSSTYATIGCGKKYSQNCISIGVNSVTNGDGSISISGTVNGNNSVAIQAIVNENDTVAIGGNATKVLVGTGTVIGHEGTQDIIFGGKSFRDYLHNLNSHLNENGMLEIGISDTKKIILGSENSDIYIGGYNFKDIIERIESLESNTRKKQKLT